MKHPDILQAKGKKDNNKSVLSSNAQSVIPCAVRELDQSLYSTLVNSIINNHQIPMNLKWLVWAHYHTGCRISEILKLSPPIVNVSKRVYIKACKGSENRVCIVPPIHYISSETRIQQGVLSEYYDRYFIYRLYKKVGISAIFGNNINKSITHVFRHNVALNVIAECNDKSFASKALGHKNKDNIKFYENEQRKKSRN